MYKCKTYNGQLRQYLKSIPYKRLVNVFLENVQPDYLEVMAIKYFSNPDIFTIAELQELFE